MHSDDVARALAAEGLYVSNGDFYATTVIERIGHAHDGIVRAGAAIYTTRDEVVRLLTALPDIVRRGARGAGSGGGAS